MGTTPSLGGVLNARPLGAAVLIGVLTALANSVFHGVIESAHELFWVDLGLLRQATGSWGPLTGELFEAE